MSTNACGEEKEVSGTSLSGSTAQAPKLRGSAHYAAWRRDMGVWLERYAAGGVHLRVIDASKWKQYVALVEKWAAEDLDEAMSFFDDEILSAAGTSGKQLSGGSIATSTVSGESPEDIAKAKARKGIVQMVQNSTRVYGVLFASLPEDLRSQAGSIVPSGFAYGLWKWLESKFQSVEQANVSELLNTFFTLRQEDDESYDAYRARVASLYALLENAGETPSAAMRSVMLLDRLTARYSPVVLALKAGGQLADAKAINWEKVTALINNHERNELRAVRPIWH